MKTINFSIIALLFTAIACSSKPEEGKTNALNLGESSSAVDASKCLLEYQTKLDQLLPLETIQKHYKGDMSKAKKDYYFRPTAKNHDTDTYTYNWDSDRTKTMTIAGRSMTVPVSNQIGLAWVGSDMFMMPRKATPLENFRFFYRNMTAQEKEDAFKKAGEVMKNKGYDEKTTNTAINMGKDLAAEEKMFETVEGIGEAAVWRIKEKNLIVLTGNKTFQVVVNISANDQENIALAKKLAAEVLEKCK